jgi:hypothetical protein
MFVLGRNLALVLVLVLAACNSQETPALQMQRWIDDVPMPTRESSIRIAEPEDEAEAEAIDVAPLELHPVIRSRSALKLFETDDGTHFVVANVEAIRLPLRGPIARDRKFLAGLADPGPYPTESWNATVLGGRWPHSLYMVVETESRDSWRTPQVYRFAGSSWEAIDNTQPPLAWSWVGVSPWRDRQTLALRTWAPMISPSEGDDGRLQGHAAIRDLLLAKAPRAFEPLVGADPSAPELHGHKIAVFDSLPSGEVIAVSAAQTLHWSAGETSPRVVTLDAPPRAAKLEMFAADDAYLLDERTLLHFDGTAWTPIDVPRGAGVSALARGSDKTVWVVTDSASSDPRLLEWRPDATWRERTLPGLAFPGDAERRAEYWAIGGRDGGDSTDYVPEPMSRDVAARELPLVPIDVAVHGDALWITAAEPDDPSSEHWALFHSVSRGAVVELPDLETMRRELVDMGPEVAFAGQDDCEVFVPISVRSVAGPHLDLQRKLADVLLEDDATMLLLEVQRDGKRAIGVVLPNGAEINWTLVESLRKALGRRMGTPLCQDTIPRRQLARFP